MKLNCISACIVLALSCTFWNPSASGQSPKKAAQPAWIAMMDDPNVNYYEAVKQFDQYWKNRVKPVVENDMFESAEDEHKKEEVKRKKERLSDTDPAKLYAFEYKKFLWWMRQTEPFVQPDGRIKSMDERVKEWKTQEQQRKVTREPGKENNGQQQ